MIKTKIINLIFKDKPLIDYKDRHLIDYEDKPSHCR